MLFRFLLFALVPMVVVVAQGDLSTCARMDVPLLDKMAHALCIASCQIQNCGTGECEKRGNRPTCVCYRCGNGRGTVLLAELTDERNEGDK